MPRKASTLAPEPTPVPQTTEPLSAVLRALKAALVGCDTLGELTTREAINEYFEGRAKMQSANIRLLTIEAQIETRGHRARIKEIERKALDAYLYGSDEK